MRIGEKLKRVAGFLVAFRERSVMSAMQRSGFTATHLAEGWRLAQEASSPRLRAAPKVENVSEARQALEALDAWENENFPVIDATLVRRYPEIHRRVIGGLSQTEGPELLLTIPTLLANIRALEAAGDGESRKARALLAERGITSTVVEQAATLITQASAANLTPAVISPEEVERQRVESEAAAERAWAWYLEWSRIARARVKSARALYLLGFGRSSRPAQGGVDDEIDDEIDDGGDEPTQPVQPVQPGQPIR